LKWRYNVTYFLSVFVSLSIEITIFNNNLNLC
jgi:hypothetical protein